MRPIIYALTILIVPGGFLFCIVNMVNRRRKRLMIEARLNAIFLDAGFGRMAEDERAENRAPWAGADPYGKGSESSYVPDWAVPEDQKKRSGPHSE